MGSGVPITPIPNSTQDVPSAISCPTAGNCTVIGTTVGTTVGSPLDAYYAVESNGVWEPDNIMARQSGDSDILNSISCPSLGNCTIVGQNNGGNVVKAIYTSEIDGVWGPVTAVPVVRGGDLSSVSCADATDCTAVGQGMVNGLGSPLRMTETNGVWTPAVEFTVANQGGFLGVSCPDATDCMAVGWSHADHSMYDDEVSGVWGVLNQGPTRLPSTMSVTFGQQNARLSTTAQTSLVALSETLMLGTFITITGHGATTAPAKARATAVKTYLSSWWPALSITLATVTSPSNNTVAVTRTKY